VQLLVALPDQVGVEVHVVVHLLVLLPFSVGSLLSRRTMNCFNKGHIVGTP
jgi:hypothetical protein